jgi:hypothetical protein
MCEHAKISVPLTCDQARLLISERIQMKRSSRSSTSVDPSERSEALSSSGSLSQRRHTIHEMLKCFLALAEIVTS